MRWETQKLEPPTGATPAGLLKLSSLVRSVQTPEFEGVTFHEVLAKTALNHVPVTSRMLPGAWTVNPYRGCSHACVYCYARNTHRYLDLDTGADFDRQIVVKVNVAEVLARELTAKRERPERVALGTNTDPYQRAEGRYALLPGIIEALAAARVPFSILTKGTLLRRDLPLLAEVAREQEVSLAMSIAVFDDQLQALLEPGTPTTGARLATVRRIRELGLDCAVFLAPIMPGLTDSADQLDQALGLIAAAGATSVFATSLRLGPDVREWYLRWLERHRPELLPRYAELYAPGLDALSAYRRRLDDRLRGLLKRHGLQGTTNQGGPATTAETRFSLDRAATLRTARGATPAARPDGQPSLF